MHLKTSLSILICLCLFYANGQEQQYTITGHVNYKNSKELVRVRLSCTDGYIKATYTDSLGNYTLTRGINKDLSFGTNNGILNCAVLFEPPDYKRCGHCPHYYRELTVESEQSRRLSIKLDSVISGTIIDATITGKLLDEHLPASITFNKNSALFSNYFSGDTLLDCVADYLLNCNGCYMEISGFADEKETDKQHLSEQRAEKVYNLLLKRGVDAKLLEYKGYSDGDAPGIISGNKNLNKYRVDFLLKKGTGGK